MNIKTQDKDFDSEYKTNIFNSIQTRLVILVIIILLITIVSNNMLSGYLFNKEYTLALESEIKVIGQSTKIQLDRILSLGMSIENIMGYDVQCTEIVNKYSNVTFAYISDINGKILFKNDNYNNFTKDSLEEMDSIKNLIMDGNESIFNTHIQDEEYKIFLTPFKSKSGNISGAILLGIKNSIILDKIKNQSFNSLILSLLFIFIGSILTIYFQTKLVSNPLKKLSKFMEEAGNGNLSVHAIIKSRGEIKVAINNFNKMIFNMRYLTSEVNISTKNVLDFSKDLSSSADQYYKIADRTSLNILQIANVATKQSADISSVVDYLNDLSKSLGKVGSDMESVSKIVYGTKQVSENSIDTIQELNKKAYETRNISETFVDNIHNLNEQMNEIFEIVNVIRNITRQSNLLSLNASIEASKVGGEAGKGFTVVAGAIKKFADQSKYATEKIINIVNNIQIETDHISQSAETSKLTLNKHLNAVEDTSNSFKTILDEMSKITACVGKAEFSLSKILTQKNKTIEYIKNISTSTQETVKTADTVFSVTKEQKSAAESFNSISERMENIAKSLNKATNNLKT